MFVIFATSQPHLKCMIQCPILQWFPFETGTDFLPKPTFKKKSVTEELDTVNKSQLSIFCTNPYLPNKLLDAQ